MFTDPSLNLAEHRIIDAQWDPISVQPKSCINVEIHMQKRGSNWKHMSPLFPAYTHAHPLSGSMTTV